LAVLGSLLLVAETSYSQILASFRGPAAAVSGAAPEQRDMILKQLTGGGD
jgi:hypothetical protein